MVDQNGVANERQDVAAASAVTRGTHQVGAFVAGVATLAFVAPVVGALPPAQRVFDALGLGALTPPANWESLLGFLIAALVGGTAPDVDKPRHWWARLLAHTTFGGHRHLSHSLVGLAIFTVGFTLLARALAPAVGASAALVSAGFVAGYLSHLLLDSLTIEGVPWLFPIPTYFGFPPASGLRLKTGGLIEQFVVMPLLLGAIGWIGYSAGAQLVRWWR
jgi:inner membrane protein